MYMYEVRPWNQCQHNKNSKFNMGVHVEIFEHKAPGPQ